VPSPDLFAKILDAYYEAEFADPPNQAAKTAVLESLIDQAIEGTAYSRSWFVELMGARYRDYRNKRKKREGIPSKLIEGTAPEIKD
jgi:hypothetical protein